MHGMQPGGSSDGSVPQSGAAHAGHSGVPVLAPFSLQAQLTLFHQHQAALLGQSMAQQASQNQASQQQGSGALVMDAGAGTLEAKLLSLPTQFQPLGGHQVTRGPDATSSTDSWPVTPSTQHAMTHTTTSAAIGHPQVLLSAGSSLATAAVGTAPGSSGTTQPASTSGSSDALVTVMPSQQQAHALMGPPYHYHHHNSMAPKLGSGHAAGIMLQPFHQKPAQLHAAPAAMRPLQQSTPGMLGQPTMAAIGAAPGAASGHDTHALLYAQLLAAQQAHAQAQFQAHAHAQAQASAQPGLRGPAQHTLTVHSLSSQLGSLGLQQRTMSSGLSLQPTGGEYVAGSSTGAPTAAGATFSVADFMHGAAATQSLPQLVSHAAPASASAAPTTTPAPSGSTPDVTVAASAASASLYVKNLPPDSERDAELFLYQKFAPHGALLSCKVKTDPSTGKCRGVGFVNYVDQGSALRAMQQLHGTRTPEGRQLHITLQAPRAVRAAAAAAAAAAVTTSTGSSVASLPASMPPSLPPAAGLLTMHETHASTALGLARLPSGSASPGEQLAGLPTTAPAIYMTSLHHQQPSPSSGRP